MTPKLRILLIIFIFLYFYTVFRLLKKKNLVVKYALLWLVVGVIMAVLVIFPSLLTILCDWFGIVGQMNGLFIFCIAFTVLLLMSLTIITSRQSEKIRNLIQYCSLLEERIRRLENKDE